MWAPYLMLACYYSQVKQLASGVVCWPVNFTITSLLSTQPHAPDSSSTIRWINAFQRNRVSDRAFTRFRWNALIRQGWRISIHFEGDDVILCRTELWLRWVPVRCVSCFACGKSWRMFNFSRGNACVSQSNCLSCITDSTGANQSDGVYALHVCNLEY